MIEAATPTLAAPVTHEEQLASLAEVFGDEYANDFQDPVVFRRFEFFSPGVKQFYKREFPLISRTLFTESVYRRRPQYSQEILDAFSAMSAKKLADIHQMLTTQCDRVRQLCKTNGQDTDAAYLHSMRKLVPVIASDALTYVRCLVKLDELYQLTGSAKLNGVIDGDQRKKFELLCRRAVRAYSNMLRNEIIKLRKESLRVRTAGSSPEDKHVEKAEQAQDVAIQDFDKEMQQEAQHDPASVVEPSAAGGVIDSITSAVAAVTGTKKPRSTKRDAQPASADAAAS